MVDNLSDWLLIFYTRKNLQTPATIQLDLSKVATTDKECWTDVAKGVGNENCWRVCNDTLQVLLLLPTLYSYYTEQSVL